MYDSFSEGVKGQPTLRLHSSSFLGFIFRIHGVMATRN